MPEGDGDEEITPANYPVFTGIREDPNMYQIETDLSDGQHSIIVDTGSVGNLCGNKWVQRLRLGMIEAGHTPEYSRRARSLMVNGVGNGAQEAAYDVQLTLGLKNTEGEHVLGNIEMPCVTGTRATGGDHIYG